MPKRLAVNRTNNKHIIKGLLGRDLDHAAPQIKTRLSENDDYVVQKDNHGLDGMSSRSKKSDVENFAYPAMIT